MKGRATAAEDLVRGMGSPQERIREESPHGRTPRPGRPSFVERPGSDVYVPAFDVRADACTAAQVRLGGDVLDGRTVPLSPSDPDTAAAQIAHAGRLLGQAAELTR
ncbi:hypothetical protein ACGFI3_04800 [Nonomuraea wenchangensis]|uniref:hypothetical protein n=1 Tax=Nonomuraea wenchangensis TaxID=568860 RepID=UPI003715FEBB